MMEKTPLQILHIIFMETLKKRDLLPEEDYHTIFRWTCCVCFIPALISLKSFTCFKLFKKNQAAIKLWFLQTSKTAARDATYRFQTFYVNYTPGSPYYQRHSLSIKWY